MPPVHAPRGAGKRRGVDHETRTCGTGLGAGRSVGLRACAARVRPEGTTARDAAVWLTAVGVIIARFLLVALRVSGRGRTRPG